MSTIDRAAEVLLQEGIFEAEAHCYTQALADAGLLAPDPVPPSYSEDRSPQWFYLGDQIVATSGCGDIGIQHNVVIDDGDGSPVHSERWIDLTPEDARHLAAILLTAAADYAEGVGTDGQDD